jgi:endo-1,4-beta-mannosidase
MINKISEKFFTGINYWDSKSAINMWDNFDIESIENDFKLLKDAGITHLRVFPLWSVFQPLCAIYDGDGIYEYSFGENPLPDTEAGKAGMSEQACEKFEAFCTLAEKYDMKLVVALITGHMSGRTYNPPVFDGKALMSDPTVLKWQIRFVKYFVKRFKEQSAIVGWDLGNESIYIPGKTDNPDTFYVWASIISDAAKSVDSTHPIISGLDNSSI